MAALEGRRDNELAAVLDALGLEGATIVAHDASGPLAIDLAQTAKTASAPFFCSTPTTATRPACGSPR
jgi:hypothetical protein